MRAPQSAYSFLVLRYVHDVVSSEFVNIGVVLYSPDFPFLGARFSSSYSRIADFFGGVDGSNYRSIVRHLQESVEQAAEYYCKGLPLSEMPLSIEKFAASILPVDDSALQFSPQAGGGLTANPEKTLQELYVRYVELHIERPDRQRRDDSQILSIFKTPLRENRVLSQLRAKTIESPVYTWEFPLAWKNGVWNVCEPISFDLAEGSSILEKANHWVGRATSLKRSNIDFKMFLLLGRPSKPELWKAFSLAEAILQEVPVEHEVFRDDRTRSFAERVVEELREHPQEAFQ